MFATSPPILCFLFVAAFGAGFVDAIAGGGGLITVPALLGIGLPPSVALGTNKLQATFGSGSAALHFLRAGRVRLAECRSGILWTAVGASLGVGTVQLLDPGLLRQLIPWLLLAIALYTWCTPSLGSEDLHPRLAPAAFYCFCGLGIGWYDGFFGPGTGSFWALAFVVLLGMNLTSATAHTKVMNFSSNGVALLLFMGAGQVYYAEGVLMGIAQFLGARLGARMVLRRGAAFIRPVFIAVVLAITARLFWQNYHR